MFVLTNTTKKFIPESQREEENPLAFLIKPPTKKVILDLQEEIFKNANIETDDLQASNIPLSNMINLYLDTCVIGWENVVDEAGKAIPFTKENFEFFSESTILIEVYNFCRELSESTEKN
jgi:hypothetical protein